MKDKTMLDLNELLEFKEEARKNRNQRQNLKGRVLVTSKELYEIRKIMGVEDCSYRRFQQKINEGKILYKRIEVPHPYNKRQWMSLFDITDNKEEFTTYLYLKRRKKMETKKYKVEVLLDEDLYEFFQKMASQENLSLQALIRIAMMAYKRTHYNSVVDGENPNNGGTSWKKPISPT